MSTVREFRFKSYNTRRNLPVEVRRRRAEANFLGTFIRTVLQGFARPCVYGRNFPVPGCGVADLIVCELSEVSGGTADPDDLLLLAFEMKLLDWRKALQQAYRYRYYADVSIVVLPARAAARAIQSRHVFDALGVGLWTLDTSTRHISKHVTAVPRTGPLSSAKRNRAMSTLRPRLAYLGKPYE